MFRSYTHDRDRDGNIVTRRNYADEIASYIVIIGTILFVAYVALGGAVQPLNIQKIPHSRHVLTI